MSRIIRVTKCTNMDGSECCPYLQDPEMGPEYCNHPGAPWGVNSRQIPVNEIPDWCPLPVEEEDDG